MKRSVTASGTKLPVKKLSRAAVSTLDMVVVRPVFIALVCLPGKDHKQEALYGNYFNASWKARFYRICESNEP